MMRTNACRCGGGVTDWSAPWLHRGECPFAAPPSTQGRVRIAGITPDDELPERPKGEPVRSTMADLLIRMRGMVGELSRLLEKSK